MQPKITIFNSAKELGEAAAKLILDEYEQKGRLVLGVPWGTTPVPILDALAGIVRKNKADLAEFHMVMMDEYVEKGDSRYSFVNESLPISGHCHMDREAAGGNKHA